MNTPTRPWPVRLRRVVVKVGSSVLSHPGGALDHHRCERLVAQLIQLRGQGTQVVFVSSGAIAAGMGSLGFKQRPRRLPQLQAAASVGQGQLMRLYDELFGGSNVRVGQILLTRDDLANRQRYLNARHTLLTLLEAGVVPIVNENDTVAVEEIRFGDNDQLSALVAGLVHADALVILSDVDGLLQHGRAIPVVEAITPELTRLAGGTSRATSTGGMATKLEAARIAMHSGIPLIIANGDTPQVLTRLAGGEPLGTLFLPRSSGLAAKKRWLAFAARRVQGAIVVDEGAQAALSTGGKSLLASGIIAARGQFIAGELVSVTGRDDHEFARGISNYSAQDVARVRGLKTAQIRQLLGERTDGEVIHRDNLVIL